MDGRQPPAPEDAAAAVDPRLVAALAVQLEAWRARLRAGAVRVGWKLGVGDGERIGGELAVGHLTSATVLAPGATYAAGDAGDLRADVEVAFELGAGAGSGLDPPPAARVISGVAVALELVDLAGPAGDPEAVVAANIYHRAVAFGPFRPLPLPAGVQGQLLVNGRVAGSAPVAADITGRLGAAARVLAAAGQRLQPGDRVITGSVAQVSVRPGDRVAGDLGPLGRVELSIRP